MKTLVTHLNPHIDDIAAIWLFQRFHPDFKNAKLKFVSASNGQEELKDAEDKIHLGVGRGQFDEHKGDLEDCATSLVWKYLKDQGLPKDQAKLSALVELVEWVRLGDLGKLPPMPYDDFSVPSFIRAWGGKGESGSQENTHLGFEILDRILLVLINKHRSILDWENRVPVETRWGKGYAISSEHVNRAFCQRKDGAVYLMYDPRYQAVQYFTPKEEVDLEPIFKRVTELDPKASWFLHQSHHMVICGSASAPSSKRTKLTFEQLVKIFKSV